MAKVSRIRRRIQPLSMLMVLFSTAIAPLILTPKIQAREISPKSDAIKACRNESLLPPNHPDVRSLDQLYQRYLGYTPPNLDLGLTTNDLAQYIVQFSRFAEQASWSSDHPQWLDHDQTQLNELRTRYSRAITALEQSNQSSIKEDQRFGRPTQRTSSGSRTVQISPPSVSPPPAPAPSPTVEGLFGNRQKASFGSLSESAAHRPPTSRPPVTTLDRPSLELPPEFNTEDYARISDNPFFIPTQVPLSTFSVDVDTASYSNVRRFLKQGQLPPKDAVRIEEMINYFSYDYAEPNDNQPFSINTEIAQAPWNPAHKLVQIGLKGQELQTRQPSNLVFLIDVSGSMRSPNKLQLLQRSLCMLVREMTPEDRVTLVTYAGNAGLVLPPTPGREKKKILQAIANLEAGGSTAGAAGIDLAYDMAQKHFLSEGNNRVVLATDGDFNVGISSHAELERLIEKKREQGVYLSVLGFGTGNYKDSKMEILANKGNGNYAYIDTLAEARKVLVEDLTSTLFTIAKDVKIQVEFNPTHVQAYRLIGYENRLLRDQDFNDDRKDAGEIGAGHTVTALYEIIPPGVQPNFDLPDIDDLKYQRSLDATNPSDSSELMQVKLRYKNPDQSKSQLITHPIQNQTLQLSEASSNLRFASAVAMFGMILRESEFKGKSDLQTVTNTLNSLGPLNTYQAEFQTLVAKAQSIQQAVK